MSEVVLRRKFTSIGKEEGLGALEVCYMMRRKKYTCRQLLNHFFHISYHNHGSSQCSGKRVGIMQ